MHYLKDHEESSLMLPLILSKKSILTQKDREERRIENILRIKIRELIITFFSFLLFFTELYKVKQEYKSQCSEVLSVNFCFSLLYD